LQIVRSQHIITKYSVETMSLYSLTHRKNMKFLSEKMLAIMERLSEMFPGSSYQSRLDSYLSTKGITDAAQLENYIQQYNYSQKEKYL
jgi:hypothetical protein